MLVNLLISKNVAPLKPKDTVEYGINLMREFRVSHLPVVNKSGILVGLLSENQLLDAIDPTLLIKKLLGPNIISVDQNAHTFDATRLMIDHGLTVLPVTASANKYLGLVRRFDLFEHFASILSAHQPGAILALEIEPEHYSLTQLAHIIEQSDAKILSTVTEDPGENGNKRITVKLNISDTSRIRHVLEHYGYKVVATFSNDESSQDIQDRAMEFLHYLDV